MPRTSPVKNKCQYPGCGKTLSSDHSTHCREHYNNRSNEANIRAEEALDKRKRHVIPDLKCPDCGGNVRYNEGFSHKLKELCHSAFLDCSGGECHWAFLMEKEVENG